MVPLMSHSYYCLVLARSLCGPIVSRALACMRVLPWSLSEPTLSLSEPTWVLVWSLCEPTCYCNALHCQCCAQEVLARIARHPVVANLAESLYAPTL